MLFYTENVHKFAFSTETTDICVESPNQNNNDSPKFGILGVPFDGTASYMPGARFGPRYIREASYNFEKYNLILNEDMDTELCDFGDLEVVHGNFKETCSRLKTTISEILEMEIIPITIGGDHSISYCVIKAIGESNGFDISETTIIHFDAHMDLREHYMGDKYSHATVMHNIFYLNPREIIQIGVRSASQEEVLFAGENNLKVYKSDYVDENLDEIIEYIKNIDGSIYVSFDMDVMDPAYAPTVGTPAPCGLSPKQVEKLIKSLKGKDFVGFDLVEVSSNQTGDITSLNAAKIIYDFLCLQ